jgi:hypothetical protein
LFKTKVNGCFMGCVSPCPWVGRLKSQLTDFIVNKGVQAGFIAFLSKIGLFSRPEMQSFKPGPN